MALAGGCGGQGAAVDPSPAPPSRTGAGEAGRPEGPSGRSGSLTGDDSALFRRGLRLLGEERFAAADSALRQVVERCARRDEAARALLALSSLHLDPRNPSARPDSAALMAARYLARPGAPPLGRRLAEGLWVQALDRGADPAVPPSGEGAGGALCLASDSTAAPLPTLEGPRRAELLEEVSQRLDSLDAVHRASLREVEELEAELARIRRLLQEPDTLAPAPGGGDVPGDTLRRNRAGGSAPAGRVPSARLVAPRDLRPRR